MSNSNPKAPVPAETLARRTTALWLFVAALVAVILVLRFMEMGHEQSEKMASIPPAKEPSGEPTWAAAKVDVKKLTKNTDKKPPIQVDENPSWAKHLDLSEARLIGERFVQKTEGGKSLWYTVDPRLQKRAMEIFRHYEIPYAAAVMMDVKTGRILLMAGRSEADPGLKAFGLCLQAWAPAASVFKVVTTAALLSENRARPFTRICYHGGSHGLKPHHLIDDKKKDNQCDTLSGALAKSINPIMGKLARRHLNRKTLLKYANAFGFNADLDFVRPVAVSPAAIPKGSFARAEVAAGFWQTNLSPLHGALMAQAIANRGIMIRPRLVDLAQDKTGEPLAIPKKWKKQVVTEYIARLLGRMMVMTTTVGTARGGFYDRKGRSYVPWGKVAGKTGSLTREDPYVAYNWFMGFAPHDKPEVAFAVLLGNPRKWRIKASAVARFLLRSYGKLRPYHPPGTLPSKKREKKRPNRR